MAIPSGHFSGVTALTSNVIFIMYSVPVPCKMTFSHLPKRVYLITLEKPVFVYTKTPVQEEKKKT